MPLVRKDLAAPSPSADRSAIEILRTGTADQRWNAARAVGLAADAGGEAGGADPSPGGIRAAAEVRDGTKALAEALKTEADPRVREAIFTSLVRIGSKECVDAVIPCLRGD